MDDAVTCIYMRHGTAVVIGSRKSGMSCHIFDAIGQTIADFSIIRALEMKLQ